METDTREACDWPQASGRDPASPGLSPRSRNCSGKGPPLVPSCPDSHAPGSVPFRLVLRMDRAPCSHWSSQERSWGLTWVWGLDLGQAACSVPGWVGRSGLLAWSCQNMVKKALAKVDSVDILFISPYFFVNSYCRYREHKILRVVIWVLNLLTIGFWPCVVSWERPAQRHAADALSTDQTWTGSLRPCLGMLEG